MNDDSPFADYEPPVGPPAGPEPPDGEAPFELQLAWLPRSDLGNAQRLMRRFGEDLVFTEELGWFWWDGRCWRKSSLRPDKPGGAAMRKAHATAEAIGREVSALRDRGKLQGETNKQFEERLAKHVGWGVQAGNHGRAANMLASAAPYLAEPADALDAAPYLMAVQNGTLELGPGAEVRLRAHRREDRITRLSGVPYEPDANAPRFRKFLERIQPDEAVRIFLQKWFGYCLTADIGAQIVVAFYGLGANGKSQLLIALRGVMGDYALSLPFESLQHDERRRGSEATPDMVRLPGARLATASEPEVGTRLSEGLIKGHTGGEPITIRPLYGSMFEVLPTHKLVLSFNNRPRIAASDEGTWRRIALVPFDVLIPPAERVPHLGEQLLRDEGPGILNWALDGFRLWREDGLVMPEAVQVATADYRTESDPLGDFLAACVSKVTGERTLAGALYRAYQQFCKANAFEPVTNTRFGKLMTEHGFSKYKSGLVYYLDCKLTDPPSLPPDQAASAEGFDDGYGGRP